MAARRVFRSRAARGEKPATKVRGVAVSMRNDPRSTEELIRIALMRPEDDDARWEAVTALHHRATEEVFEAARNLCESARAEERTLGVDILGQLGVPERIFVEESLPVLFKCLTDRDVSVVRATAHALGHIRDPRVVKPLAGLKSHVEANIRLAVASSIGGYEDPVAVRTLIELSQDEDADVRGWATFGLGSQIEIDNEEIRDALWGRVQDDDAETRGEALLGLAIRREKRVVDPLISELSGELVQRLVVEAAGKIGDPRLYPVLSKLKNSWDGDMTVLEEAIKRCAGEN